MKLVGLMSLREYRDKMRTLFEQNAIRIYSEIEITGHTAETIKDHGFWIFDKAETPIYSTLFFAVISDDESERLLSGIEACKEECDPKHPARAFVVPVEKLL